MKNWLIVLAVVCCVGLGYGQGGAAIEKADHARTQAVVKGDVATLNKMTADTYVFIDGTGRVSSKQELMDAFKNGTIKIQSQDLSDIKVHMYGNTAVETGTVKGQGTRDGRDVSGTYRFTRVWVRRNGTWQTVAYQQTKVE